MAKQPEYAANEYCLVLNKGKWKRAFVMEKKGTNSKPIYNVRLPDERDMEFGVERFIDVTPKKMGRAQVYFCSHCEEWLDPARIPTLGPVISNKTEKGISLDVEPRCVHGDIPYSMRLVPWTEVAECSAIGGIHKP